MAMPVSILTRERTLKKHLMRHRGRGSQSPRRTCAPFTGATERADSVMDVCKDNPEILRRRLAAQERELESMRRFSKLRSEMASNITKVEKEMRRKYAMANTLELLIVMDCTASMNPWIEEAKSSIISIIDGVKKDHPKADVRVGFVAYRDFCDGVNRLQVHSLTTDVSTVRTVIASLRAFGGGDGPEDVPGGLAAALEMPFQAEAKRIVLVSDAPCHGSKFNDGGGDMTYCVQIEQSPDICAQMREMAKRGFDFTFIEIQPAYTAKMVDATAPES